MNLHSAGHRRGVVAAPHAAAVEDGRAILAEGGNAIEAMIAMAASIAAVYPHMNHVGGDGFWLIREPSGRVRAIMGAGRAGSRATLQFYRDAGHHEIPARGPLAALTVPGAVAGWMLAAEARRKRNGGKLPLDLLLTRSDQTRARGLHGDAQPGAADGGKIAGDEGRGRLQASLSDRRQSAGGGRQAQADRLRRHARSTRPSRA